MYKKEGPKLNKENFPTWKSLMKLHIISIANSAWPTVENGYLAPTITLTSKQLKVRKEHNQAMLEIVSTLSYLEYKDVKLYTYAKLMLDSLATIYRGDTNVIRAKVKILRGKFDDMKMLENETIAHYCVRVKDVVNAIKGANGKIQDETVVSKFFRTLLPKYAIRVSFIQELR